MITFDAAEQGWQLLEKVEDLSWEFPYTNDEGQYVQSMLNTPKKFPCLFKPRTYIENGNYGFDIVADFIYDFTGECQPAWKSSSYNC